jgi:hypothetical protein
LSRVPPGPECRPGWHAACWNRQAFWTLIEDARASGDDTVAAHLAGLYLG